MFKLPDFNLDFATALSIGVFGTIAAVGGLFGGVAGGLLGVVTGLATFGTAFLGGGILGGAALMAYSYIGASRDQKKQDEALAAAQKNVPGLNTGPALPAQKLGISFRPVAELSLEQKLAEIAALRAELARRNASPSKPQDAMSVSKG